MRQKEPDVRSYAVTHSGGTVVLPQPSGWDQLVHASSGVMTVQADAAHWVITPQRAVWVPDGISHRIELAGRVRLRTLYLRAGVSGLNGGVRALHVGPLLRELVLHVVATAPLWLDDGRSEHLIRVLVDQIDDQAPVPLRLPWPRDERARALAELILSDPRRTIADLALETGASVRTLERLFAAETALTPQRWRIRARLLHATRLVAQGEPVTTAALASGYATASAFAAAFRDEVGTTPTRYVAGES